MTPIKEVLNDIIWNENKNAEEYTILYQDMDRMSELNASEIKIDGSFMKVELEIETFIPLHRVREVRKGEKIIWDRKQL